VRETYRPRARGYAVDLIIINAENAAGGFGLTPQLAEEVLDLARMC